ncbi:MAG TPA: ankyrin repeat domain-containing protein, partial [Bacillota bacterium]|nr:ankyrin repeat domain-containing protein [Bacillota bacterium]
MKRVLTAGLVASLLCLAFAASAAASLLPFDPEWTAAEVGYLVAAGAEVNARDENGWTPLMFAAAWADIETVSVLFEAGADVNASSTSGWTALMSAMACGNWPQVVGEFRLVGLEDDWSWDWGDEDAGDDWGWDDWWDDDDDWEWDDEEDWSWENWYDDDEDWPEEAASPWREPNPLVIRSLVAAGADVNVCTEDGWTPLMIAVLCNADCEIVEDLIAAGAEVNARNEFGQTPLILAVENDTDIEVVAELIGAGARVNAKTKDGMTPLMLAVHN